MIFTIEKIIFLARFHQTERRLRIIFFLHGAAVDVSQPIGLSFRRFAIMAAAVGRICGARLLKTYGTAAPQVLKNTKEYLCNLLGPSRSRLRGPHIYYGQDMVICNSIEFWVYFGDY